MKPPPAQPDPQPPGDGETFALLYEHLHKQASNYMRRQPAGHTLQPTALVHEAFLKLYRGRELDWTSAQHFLAVAARTMINVLVDHARGKQRKKRKASGQRVPLEAVLVHFQHQQVDIIDLQSKLDELAAMGPDERRAATIVELRAFAGSTMAEIATYLGVSKRTVERDFRFARAWLHDALDLAHDGV